MSQEKKKPVKNKEILKVDMVNTYLQAKERKRKELESKK